MKRSILSVEIKYEHDVVLTRQRAKQIAALLGFEAQDQTRIATSASEIARNAFRYTGGGRAEFSIDDETSPPTLLIRITDTGPGISNLSDILEGRYQSQTGMGLGLIGAKRLSDRFEIETAHRKGTAVLLGKTLPKSVPTVAPTRLATITEELARRNPQNPVEEIQQQNQELLRTLDALRIRQAEVEKLNEELAETNRGVLALYAELDDKAEDLRRASDLKTKFLSNMTHELRTPLNSIIMLSRMMLTQKDGPLNPEHERQATFIRNSADGLLDLVNDLLDLAKIEAGKVDINPSEFSVAELFGTLRGMFRPLIGPKDVELLFEMPEPAPLMHTDEGKLGQILRNLVSNAMKFTERGEIRVTAVIGESDMVMFSVADTGIGIGPEDRRRLFQEFTQVTGKYQVKGTGLGLSISRRLAELLGGRIELESEVGVGSVFRVFIPLDYHPVESDGQSSTPAEVKNA
ncbi:MAG TPA: ATP-binding protein [Tepidisphaeraceae bacterium]|nr:ATP-binding protein [Tepidisphaeraceae bacterium]